ncbi:MAG: nuclear transport factor 2 family protein [Alphaproteobacteria bacterium]|nr:nuclear transport factor 2 family protein [Alphaproteobacteria bacterium]
MSTLAQPRAASATDVARRFIQCLEARDLDAADALRGPGCVFEFPGPNRFASVRDQVAWSRDRYRSVQKTILRCDEASVADGTIVTMIGTLAGTWPDGTAFAGIRFIDRFHVQGGHIHSLMVWNDLALHRPD